MNIFADHDVYAATVRFLRDLGHDVVTAAERAMAQSADADLLATAMAEGRLIVTLDRDYGRLVFRGALGAGVIYLRVTAAALQAVHAELNRVLCLYDSTDLRRAFVVVEPGSHRIRRLSVSDGS